MAALKTLIARWRSDSGAEFVEFALAFPLLILVVLGIMDFGMMFQQYEVITNAAREGARVGSVPTYTLANAEQRALDYANAALLSGGGTVDPPVATEVDVAIGGGPLVCSVNVVVTYQHQYLFISGLMGFSPKTLTASATMRREGATGPC